jgi:hypothetical protein
MPLVISCTMMSFELHFVVRSVANDCAGLKAAYQSSVDLWKTTVPAATGVTNFNIVSPTTVAVH